MSDLSPLRAQLRTLLVGLLIGSCVTFFGSPAA